MAYNLRIGDYKCKVVTLPKNEKEKMIRVDKNKVPIARNERVTKNINGEVVEDVYYISEDTKEFLQPFERTTEISEGEYKEVPKSEALDIIENSGYVVISSKLKEYLKSKDIALKFLYVKSTSFTPHIAIVYYHNLSDKVLLKTTEYGFYTEILSKINDSEDVGEVEKKIGRKIKVALTI